MLIRPAEQIPIQNPLVQSKFRGGGEGETVCNRKAMGIYQIFQTRLQAMSICLSLSMEPCV